MLLFYYMILKYIPVIQALISSVTLCVHNEMSFVVALFTPSPNSNTVSVWPGLGHRLRLNRGWGGKWTKLVNSETLKTLCVGFRFCTWADSLSCHWLNEGFRPFQMLSEYEDVRKEISRVMSRKKVLIVLKDRWCWTMAFSSAYPPSSCLNQGTLLSKNLTEGPVCPACRCTWCVCVYEVSIEDS